MVTFDIFDVISFKAIEALGKSRVEDGRNGGITDGS